MMMVMSRTVVLFWHFEVYLGQRYKSRDHALSASAREEVMMNV